MEAPPRLDRRADDHELRAALGRDAGDLLAEAPGPGTDDLVPDGHAVRARDRARGFDPLLQTHELPVEVRIDRQLALEDGGCNEHDPGAPVCCETAGEIERVLRLLSVEQRYDDAAVGNRARPARETSEIRPPHRMSWYGTEARITFGSTSSRRLT